MGRGKFKGKPTGRRNFSTPEEMGIALAFFPIISSRLLVLQLAHAPLSSCTVACRAYLKETEWYAHDYVPTFEERLQTSMVSSTYPALICASFVGMDNIATREAFEWVTSMPEVVKDSAILSRLMNDITSFEREQKKGDCLSTLETYMKEHNTTKEVAIAKFRFIIEDAWKRTNEAFLKPTDVPIPLIERVDNFNRMSEMVYKDIDGRRPLHEGRAFVPYSQWWKDDKSKDTQSRNCSIGPQTSGPCPLPLYLHMTQPRSLGSRVGTPNHFSEKEYPLAVDQTTGVREMRTSLGRSMLICSITNRRQPANNPAPQGVPTVQVTNSLTDQVGHKSKCSKPTPWQ
ncbi:Alpha-humulene synthase, partial [Ananas comosus]